MWVVLGIIGLIALWAIFSYNRLISLKNQTLNGWKQIDVQLKRRHDLIPNLVETVKGIMKFEQTTLTQVIEARNKAISAQGVAEKAVQENALSGAAILPALPKYRLAAGQLAGGGSRQECVHGGS